MSLQSDSSPTPEEEIVEQQLNTSLTRKWIKFLFPFPACIMLILFGSTLILGTFNTTPVSNYQEWFESMLRFYTFLVIPFDIIWALLTKICRFLLNDTPKDNSNTDEETESAKDTETIKDTKDIEVSEMVKDVEFTEKAESSIDTKTDNKDTLGENNVTQKRKPKLIPFHKNIQEDSINQKTPEEIFNEKMRRISLNTFPVPEKPDPLHTPCEHFEDAAHALYFQKVFYGKEPSFQILQRLFPLLFSKTQELMSELCEAKIIEYRKDGTFHLLAENDSDLQSLIQAYYDYLSSAPVEELENLKSKIKEPFPLPEETNQVSLEEGFIDIDNMDGHTFEKYCANLLIENGYDNVEVTKGSGDQGIDVLAYKDGIKYGIQCKCYSSDIGNKAVQEAFAGKTFYNCHVAVVLTNQHFTKSAKELAKSNQVLLWDREKLDNLIKIKEMKYDNC